MSGGFNPINLAVQASLAVSTGGTSMLLEAAAQQVLQSVGQQIVGQLGQSMGLPQSVTSMAQDLVGGSGLSLGAAVSAFGDQAGLSSTDQGSLQSELNQLIQSFVEGHKPAKGEKGEGILEKIAIALGQAADNQMQKMSDLADQISNVGNSDQSQMSSLTGKMNAAGQEFGLITQALNTVLNSLGQGLSSAARKS